MNVAGKAAAPIGANKFVGFTLELRCSGRRGITSLTLAIA